MKSECSNGLTWLFGVAASPKWLQVTDSANFDVDRNELMTTMMRTKRMMRMMRMMRIMRIMRMMGMMRMMRMLRMRMRMKKRMMIMMSRAVVGLQYLLGPARENPPMQ